MNFLEIPDDGTLFRLPDAQFRYFKHFFSASEAQQLYTQLQEQTQWQQDPITVFGKTYPQPRLTALYAHTTTPYRYSGITMHPQSITPLLIAIQNKINTVTPEPFTTVLLNLYRDGKDSNGWHADNEKELGENPQIASVSFGAERYFHCKHRTLKDMRFKLLLHSGSLLLMEGKMQHHWLHHLPKTSRTIPPRINLTFRKLT